MTEAGFWAMIVTLLVSLYTMAVAILAGTHKSSAFGRGARTGILVSFISSSVSMAMLLVALLSRDFTLRYVYAHTNTHLPLAYTVSALWAGQEGSLLLWLWFACLMTALVGARRRNWDAPFIPYTVATAALAQGFLALVLVVASNPFARFPMAPLQGRGLNPLLQNIWMVMHPPAVLVGYAAYAVPFALAIGGLAAGDLSATWLRRVRYWSLLAWLLLGVGIIMGAWWAYLELSWGGYWGWDPVENASLIPWLTGTALLHSLAMQRRRGAFKRWNVWLIALTFVLCYLATFITRSGVIQSVHAFARSPVGTYFLIAIPVCLIATSYLLERRRTLLDARQDQTLPSLTSRAAGLIGTSLLMVGTGAIVLVGMLLPVGIELVQRRQVGLSTDFFNRTVVPLLQIIVLFIGVCVWLPWSGRPTQQTRQRIVIPALIGINTSLILQLIGLGGPVLGSAPAILSFGIAAFVLSSLIWAMLSSPSARSASIDTDASDKQQKGMRDRLKDIGRWVQRRTIRSGNLVHLSMVLIAVGVCGSSVYQREAQLRLAHGETTRVGPYTITYHGAQIDDSPLRRRVSAEIIVTQGGRSMTFLQPAQDLYPEIDQRVTRVAIRSRLDGDLYVILTGIEGHPEAGASIANLRILHNPLIIWIWIGGTLMLIGGLLALWPQKSRHG